MLVSVVVGQVFRVFALQAPATNTALIALVAIKLVDRLFFFAI